MKCHFKFIEKFSSTVIIIFLLSLFFFENSNLFAQQKDMKDLYYYAENLSVDNFDKFAISINSLTSKTKEEILYNKNIVNNIMKFHERIMTLNPSEKTFLIHIQVVNLYSNCAECTEVFAEEFSVHFQKNIRKSTDILNSIISLNIEYPIIRDALWNEEQTNNIMDSLKVYLPEESILFKLFKKNF